MCFYEYGARHRRSPPDMTRMAPVANLHQCGLGPWDLARLQGHPRACPAPHGRRPTGSTAPHPSPTPLYPDS